MQALDYIQMIWDYNYWGHHQLWDSLMTVSKEDFEREVNYGIGSLHSHVVHTMWAEALWLSRIKGEETMRWSTEDYPTREAVVEQWKLVESNWRIYVAGLNHTDLDVTFTANASSGTFQHKIGEALIHVVNHSTDHRAQMLRLIGDYGGQTFEQDIIFYLRAQQSSE